MTPLDPAAIRGCFVNATRREVATMTLPDLGAVAWEEQDYLGWRDTKAPLSAYIVVEVDGELVGLLLRKSEKTPGLARRRVLCSWCTDIVDTDATLYVTRRGGSSGRQGNTLGTLLCTDFHCSANVRRAPTPAELPEDDEVLRRLFVEQRVADLRERVDRFAREVLSTR
ncbi:MAG: FBP domain-containing protein [Actinomycetales bacterium]